MILYQLTKYDIGVRLIKSLSHDFCKISVPKRILTLKTHFPANFRTLMCTECRYRASYPQIFENLDIFPGMNTSGGTIPHLWGEWQECRPDEVNGYRVYSITYLVDMSGMTLRRFI